VLDLTFDLALHHCASVVVLDVALPASLRHSWAFRETLLSEVLDRVVVGICEEVVEAILLSMVLQPIHKPSAVSLHLLRCRYCKKHDLSEILRREGSKHTPAEYDWPLVLLLFDDNHGFMHAVHDQAHDVRAGHARQLLRDDVLQVN
jgi:hypothetical protein